MDKGSDTRHRWDHELAAPLGRVDSGRLVIGPKAARLTVRGDPTMADLCRTSFESPPPTVKVQGGTVTVWYPRMAWLTDLRVLLGPPPTGQVSLNTSIPWHVRVRGGTAHTSLDLSGLTLYALELGGGASHVEVILPTPVGDRAGPRRRGRPSPHRAAPRRRGRPRPGRPWRQGLTLDDQHFGAIGGSTRWHSPDYHHTTDRYDIAVTGGADTLTLDTG